MQPSIQESIVVQGPVPVPGQLQGRRLWLARTVWYVVATLAFAVLLASIPGYVGTVGRLTETERVAAALIGPPALFSPSPQFEFWADAAYDVLSFGAAALSLGLAVLIFLRRPAEPLAVTASLVLLLYGVLLAGPAEFLAGQSLAGETLVQVFSMPLWALILILFCIFPDGRFVPRWTRWYSLLLIPWSVTPAFWNPFEMDVTTAVPYMIVYTLPSLVSPFAQIYRYQRVSNAVERQQTKWVVLGVTAFTLASSVITVILMAVIVRFIAPATRVPTLGSSGLALAVRLLWPVGLTFIPLSLTVAILRFRLWDIDLVIRRTLIYGVLTVLIVLVYFGVVVGLQTAFIALGGAPRSELVTVLSTLTIAALFVPLRNRVQTAIDHRFYRRKYDAARTLAQFGENARHFVDLDGLTDGLLAVVDTTMQPAHASLWLITAAGGRAVHPPYGDALYSIK